MNTNDNKIKNQNFFTIALSSSVIIRSLKVAVIVGTILAFINYSEKIVTMSLSPQDWFKMSLSYLVPYGVSTWSAVSALRERNTTSDT